MLTGYYGYVPNMNSHTLQHVFRPPARWGLRGYPYRWQELEQALAELPPPASPAALNGLLRTLYERLVGEAPVAGNYPFVARYQGGGMSSGRVDASFWLTRGFPLLKGQLLARFEQLG